VAEPQRDRRAGGLAVAIGECLAERAALWFGWSGRTNELAPGMIPERHRAGGIELLTIDMTGEELAGYYHGFANQCLWPLLHFRIDLVRFEREFLRQYRAVNRRLAAALAPSLRPDDIIWVHDFHLVPFGFELRRQGIRQPIGFFLHVPFPPAELVRMLPGHRDLFRNLLAYDVIGFQTHADLACFRGYAQQELDVRVGADGGLRAAGRVATARAFPIGIDVDAFAELARAAEARRQARHVRASLGGRALIAGVDRLDYTKGVPQRLRAYRRFLAAHPEYRNRVVLAQISPPGRDNLDPYAQIRQETDELAGAIHGEFGELDWAPLRYLRRPMARGALAALYRASRVGLVTPLRDGMNLVAKEFVAAQDAGDPGVIVLSRFAGAAEAMDEALLVNPYDLDEVAGALLAALRMPLEERRARHDSLLAAIRANDVHAWRDAVLRELARVRASERLPRAEPPAPEAMPGRLAGPRSRQEIASAARA